MQRGQGCYKSAACLPKPCPPCLPARRCASPAFHVQLATACHFLIFTSNVMLLTGPAGGRSSERNGVSQPSGTCRRLPPPADRAL